MFVSKMTDLLSRYYMLKEIIQMLHSLSSSKLSNWTAWAAKSEVLFLKAKKMIDAFRKNSTSANVKDWTDFYHNIIKCLRITHRSLRLRMTSRENIQNNPSYFYASYAP